MTIQWSTNTGDVFWTRSENKKLVKFIMVTAKLRSVFKHKTLLLKKLFTKAHKKGFFRFFLLSISLDYIWKVLNYINDSVIKLSSSYSAIGSYTKSTDKNNYRNRCIPSVCSVRGSGVKVLTYGKLCASALPCPPASCAGWSQRHLLMSCAHREW